MPLALSVNSIVFWSLLILISLVILGVSIFTISRNKRLFNRLNQTMMGAADDIRSLERCDIANLPWIRETLDQPDFPLLGSAAEQIVEDSERLYQGKWIANPSRLFHLDNLLTRKQFTQLSREVPARMLAVSLLASALLWLLGSILFNTRSLNIFLPAAIPLMLGIVFGLIISLSNDRIKRDLERSGQYLDDLLMRRLPVFEELAGTAVLIDSFVRYDREMSESVAYLSDTIDRLAHNELADKISENIRVVMQEEIAPSYQQAAAVLVDLASTITERQETGMHDLASQFSSNLSHILADDLTPLFAEIRALTERLQSSSTDIDVGLEALQDAAELQEQLQNKTTEILERVAEGQDVWNNEISTMQDSLQQMTDMTKQLTDLYSGESMELGKKLEQLSQELNAFSVSIHEVLGGLAEENQSLQKASQNVGEQGARLLDDLRQVSLELSQQGTTLARQSNQINENLTNLNLNLTESVRQFQVQMQSGVENTLQDFDEGLAEVSLRLANTTGEIRDSLRQQQAVLRLDEEQQDDRDDGRNITRV